MQPQPSLNQHQSSMTEWFAGVGQAEKAGALREEDNHRPERLEVLYQSFGLEYERPETLSAKAITEKSPAFQEILTNRGEELCAFRLVPTKPGLPKIRQRGLSIKETYEDWFLKQEINPDDYNVEICPHSAVTLWSGIFVVQEKFIFGEIIEGSHSQLTQGGLTHQPLRFQFDYHQWYWSEDNPEAVEQVKRMVAALQVQSPEVRKQLTEKLDAKFKNEYLLGYFETTVWPGGKLYFIDFNRLLGALIPQPTLFSRKTDSDLHGIIAYEGDAQGRVVKILPEEIGAKDFPVGSILVCDNTDVRYLPLMQQAGAILTERGGLLSHAAIIARELQVPCMVGIKGLLEKVKDGDQIILDGKTGSLQVKK